VHILPYIGEQELHGKFRLDEAWDSPHNVKLLPLMPPVYRAPTATKAQDHYSSYYVLTGPTTAFAGRKGVGFEEMVDGTAHTLLAAEADRPIPWTKPEDIPYDPDKPLPKLGGLTEGGFNAATCDGAVHFFSDAAADREGRSAADQLARSSMMACEPYAISAALIAAGPQREERRGCCAAASLQEVR
jgi:hypothetical protein